MIRAKPNQVYRDLREGVKVPYILVMKLDDIHAWVSPCRPEGDGISDDTIKITLQRLLNPKKFKLVQDAKSGHVNRIVGDRKENGKDITIFWCIRCGRIMFFNMYETPSELGYWKKLPGITELDEQNHGDSASTFTKEDPPCSA